LHRFDALNGPGPLDGMTSEPSTEQLQAMGLVEPVIPARIDVRPGCANNWIRRDVCAADDWDDGGDVTVVVFGSAVLDVSAIDTSKVQFAHAALHTASVKDVDKDGRLDLEAQFRNDDLRLGPEGTMASLSAVTTTGQVVTGADAHLGAHGQPRVQDLLPGAKQRRQPGAHRVLLGGHGLRRWEGVPMGARRLPA
jgi:hypothetical protein